MGQTTSTSPISSGMPFAISISYKVSKNTPTSSSTMIKLSSKKEMC